MSSLRQGSRVRCKYDKALDPLTACRRPVLSASQEPERWQIPSGILNAGALRPRPQGAGMKGHCSHEGALQPRPRGATQTTGAVGWAEGTNLAQRISEGHGRTLWKSLLHITPRVLLMWPQPRARGVSTAREMAQLVKCSFRNQCLPRFHPQNPHFRKNRGPER